MGTRCRCAMSSAAGRVLDQQEKVLANQREIKRQQHQGIDTLETAQNNSKDLVGFSTSFKKESTKAEEETSSGCPLCGNKPMLTIMVVSSLVFLASGAAFFAPYWLFDGASFMLSSILGYLAVQQGPSNGYATATCSVAAISVLVE